MTDTCLRIGKILTSANFSGLAAEFTQTSSACGKPLGNAPREFRFDRRSRRWLHRRKDTQTGPLRKDGHDSRNGDVVPWSSARRPANFGKAN